MGDLRFKVPNAEGFDSRVWNTAYITGIEGIPWRCHHRLEGDQFSIGREIEESGKLNIVWPTSSVGNVCLSTTSLRISEEPYTLAVELARGTVNRLKSQTAEWQRAGLKLSDDFFPLAENSLSQFLHALTSVGDDLSQHSQAQQAIDLALQAAVSLCDTFSVQALEARRQSEGRLATLFGVRMQSELALASIGDALAAAFNLICVGADLGSVESSSGKRRFDAFDEQVAWANRENKKVCIGPLVNFRQGSLPQWMVLLNEGFDSVLQAACRHAQETVERYRGQTHIWNCAAGLNVPGEMDWSDEEVLRMAVSLIETVRRADERCPVLLTIDQPWSEYLRNDANGISPLHFADALIRADLGLSGLALELNFDSWPGGSFPRDPIEVNRLIDRWSMLGLPLMIILSSPTNSNLDSQHSGTPHPATPEQVRQVSAWQMASPQSGHIAPETIVRLLLSKPSVHAVIWNATSDQISGATEGAGLWDSEGKSKPLLANMAKFRKAYLH